MGTALGWLGDVLWDDTVVHLAPASPGDPIDWYGVGAASGPRLLVPAGPAAALRKPLHRYHDGHTVATRVARGAAGLLTPLAPARVLTPITRTDGFPSPVLDGIADALGVRDPRFALTLGPPRGNRKVVATVMDGGGEVLAYAKVGHDDPTRSLVSAELGWLRRLDGRAGRLRTPEVLDSFEVGGRLVALLRPIRSRLLGRRRTGELTVLAGEVHDALGTAAALPLGVSAWAADAGASLRALEPTAATALATGLLHRWAGRTVQTGLAHGDLTPWNVLRSGRGIGLIDWEFARDGVPRGLDVLRGETQIAIHLLGQDPAAALRRSRRRATALADAGASGGLPAPDLYLLHLVDTIRAGSLPSAGDADQRLAALAATTLEEIEPPTITPGAGR
jgi:hypothetical protein